MHQVNRIILPCKTKGSPGMFHQISFWASADIRVSILVGEWVKLQLFNMENVEQRSDWPKHHQYIRVELIRMLISGRGSHFDRPAGKAGSTRPPASVGPSQQRTEPHAAPEGDTTAPARRRRTTACYCRSYTGGRLSPVPSLLYGDIQGIQSSTQEELSCSRPAIHLKPASARNPRSFSRWRLSALSATACPLVCSISRVPSLWSFQSPGVWSSL